MLENQQVAFVGAGAMGGAMISGVLACNIVEPSQIIAADPRRAVSDELQRKYAIHVTTNNIVACRDADVIVLSVKPQVLNEVCEDLSGSIGSDAVVISIVAGAKLHTLVAGLNHKSIIRCMPNTPAQIGMGISVWTGTVGVSSLQNEQTKTILESLGKQLYVDDEKYLDMATALTGSGPAYIFLFMEALVEAGVNIGFSKAEAEELVHTTMEGSVAYAMKSVDNISDLRSQVTSSGGTTEAALDCLESEDFRRIVSDAVSAAYQRAIELGNNG